MDASGPPLATVAPPEPRESRRKDSPSTHSSRLPTIRLHGVSVHVVTEGQSISYVMEALAEKRGGVVITPNLDHLRRCASDLTFAALVAEADLVVADGMPLVWASRLQGTPLPERVAGSNLISTLSAAAALHGRSVFMLGGAPTTAEGAAKVLQQRHPTLKIAGCYCPPLGFESNPRQMSEIQDRLTASNADIVFVALGSPKQELLIAKLKDALPNAWWLGVGNSFSFLCGHVKRAPDWMQRFGIEWVHRLCQEPRRLFRRYVVVGLPFGMRLLYRATLNGVGNRLWRRRRPMTDVGSLFPNASNASTASAVKDAAPGRSASSPAVEAAADVPPRFAAPAAADDRLETMPPIAQADALSPELAFSSSDSVLGLDPAALLAAGGLSRGAHHGSPRLTRLRALILLGGSVRPSMLSAATERAVLDLPLDHNGSLLNFWLGQAAEVARIAGADALPVRVMVNQNSAEPVSADERYYGAFRVERDLSEYRGTGGVLRDLAADYHDDDMILVANAAQVLLDPFAAIAAALERKCGDVALISHEDGTPSGVMLLTVKTLRMIPQTGYVDMKEQALPLVAKTFDVRVLNRRRPTGLPIWNLEDYIQSLRFHHRRIAGKPVVTDPLQEDWSPAFSIIEPGAVVDPTARIHDSVVLSGGVVEAGAVLVRCVVCPGGVIKKEQAVVDQFVTGNRVERSAARGAVLGRAAITVPTLSPASAAVMTAAV